MNNLQSYIFILSEVAYVSTYACQRILFTWVMVFLLWNIDWEGTDCGEGEEECVGIEEDGEERGEIEGWQNKIDFATREFCWENYQIYYEKNKDYFIFYCWKQMFEHYKDRNGM